MKFEAFIIHIIHASSASMLIIRHAFYLSDIKQSKKYQVNELIKLNDNKMTSKFTIYDNVQQKG